MLGVFLSGTHNDSTVCVLYACREETAEKSVFLCRTPHTYAHSLHTHYYSDPGDPRTMHGEGKGGGIGCYSLEALERTLRQEKQLNLWETWKKTNV